MEAEVEFGLKIKCTKDDDKDIGLIRKSPLGIFLAGNGKLKNG